MGENVSQQVREIEEEIIRFRRELHRHPELSFEEYGTAERIEAALAQEGIPFRRVAGTGVLAQIDGTFQWPQPEPPREGGLLWKKASMKIASELNRIPRSDRSVVLRADIDALPVTEETGLEYASENPGVMHACGHDIHAACLLGALIVLNRMKSVFEGTVLGLFQPGEEKDPGGASKVLAEGVFDSWKPVAFIGQHVAPDIEAGKLGFREGKYMASGDEIHFKINGTGGHGGLPETLTDPVIATAQILTTLQEIVSRNAPPSIPTVLSFGRVVADGATNVIPSLVTVAGTLRTMDEAWRNRAKQRIREIIEGACLAHGVTAEIDIRNGFPAVVNDPRTTAIMRSVARETVGSENIVDLDIRMTAEDFGFYTQRFPAVFYRLGVGFADGREAGRLHSSTFVANEEAISLGIEFMVNSALRLVEC